MDITRTAGSVTSSVLTETLKVGRGLVSFCRRKPLGGAGVVVLASLVMIAILAPWISPYDTDETFRRAVFAPPSKDFPLGGDRVGHDVMSRLFNGARVSLRVGVISVGIGVTLGSLMGVISGYFGGKFDLIFQRFVDAFIAFPGDNPSSGPHGCPRSLSEKQCSKRYASLVESKDTNYSTTKSSLL